MRNALSMYRGVGCLATLIAILFSSVDATAYTGRLAWSPVAGATGYMIYVGKGANPYGAGVNVGARAPDADGRVRYALANLDMEVTNHFVVVSYNGAGTESVHSNELQLAYASVAAVVDSDGDALTDKAEDRNLNRGVDVGETNRHDADTDGDGRSDGAEVAAGTNALDANDPSTTGPAATPTPIRTAAPTRTPNPNATGTPPTASCDPAEQDGCALSYRFPFEGWTDGSRLGAWSVQANDAGTQGPVLVTESVGGTKFSIAYPARPDLGVALPLLSFTVRADDVFTVALTVGATNGHDYVLTYSAVDGVPTTRRRAATFPLGTTASNSVFQTTIRDLAADLHTAFGVDFATVEQAELAGTMRVAELALFAAGGVEAPEPATELVLPLAGWSKRGAGTIVHNEYAPALDAPTLSAVPTDVDRPRLVAGFPAKRDILAAPFRTLSLAVQTNGTFTIEVRVRLAKGIATLTYEPGVTSPEVRGSRHTLPLELLPIDGSAYQLVTVDLGADVERGRPGAEMRGILSVRMHGQFEVGDIVLADPID